VVILGAFLAIFTGLSYSAVALVQKRETLAAGVPATRLLGALVRRDRGEVVVRTAGRSAGVDRRDHQRRSATPDQTNSTTPNGQHLE